MRDEGRTTRVLYRNINLFVFLGVKVSVVCEADRRRETKKDYYPKLLLLAIARCVIFKTLLCTSSVSRSGVLDRKPMCTIGALSVTLSWV